MKMSKLDPENGGGEICVANIERNKATEIRIRPVEFGGRPFGDMRTLDDDNGDPGLALYAAPQSRWALGSVTKKNLPLSAYRDWLQEFGAPGGRVSND